MPALIPGPWHPSPGPQVSTTPIPANGALTSAYQNFSTDFAALCEAAVPPSGGVGPAYTATVEALLSGFYGINQGLAQWQLTDDLRDVLFSSGWTPPLPWPPHAVSWEFDRSVEPPGHGTIHWVTSLEITATLTASSFSSPIDITVDVVPVPPATLTYFPLGDLEYPLAEAQPLPGADMSPVIGSTAMPVGVSTAALSASLTDFSYLTGLSDFTAEVVLVTVLAADAQRTHSAPPAVSDRSAAADLPVLRFHFTPPQWRFLLDKRPRLRQYPRDDALGGAPRQGHASTSVQASPRQGYSNTYR